MDDIAQAPATINEEGIDATELKRDLEEGDYGAVRRRLLEQDSDMVASLLENLSEEEVQAAVAILGKDFKSEILPRLSEELLARVSPLIGRVETVKAVAELPSDDAVAVVEKLEEPRREEILADLPQSARHRIESSLAYPEDSAARLMQRECAKVPEGWNVGRVIDYIREYKGREEGGLPNKFYDIQVVDPKNHVVGVLALDTLLRTPLEKSVAEIMSRDFSTVVASTDQEDIAFLFRRKDLTSLPVVDDDDRLIGVITVDDIVDVIDEEASEDILKLSGVAGGDKFYGGTAQIIKRRFGWLLLNLAVTFVAALVIGMFTDSIQKLVTLAMFMPIAASMGGVAAVQTLAVTVRALAMKSILKDKQLRAVGRELTVNAAIGLLLGGFAAATSQLMTAEKTLSAVVGAAVFANVLFGGLLGVAVPIVLKRVGLDPAVASGPCATMGTDLFGLLTFLGLATLYVV